MLEEVYGKAAMKKIQVYEWYEHFRDVQDTVEDGLCRPKYVVV
jgi:hypothetical protein